MNAAEGALSFLTGAVATDTRFSANLTKDTKECIIRLINMESIIGTTNPASFTILKKENSLTNTISGCHAHYGCEKKESCLRYRIYQNQTGYQGWSGHQLCKLSEFTEKKYLHYIEIDHEYSD